MDREQPRVAAIVLNYNGKEMTLQALDSLQRRPSQKILGPLSSRFLTPEPVIAYGSLRAPGLPPSWLATTARQVGWGGCMFLRGPEKANSY